MTERHELRWGGFAGLAFVVLALLGRFLPGNPPTVDESQSTITSWMERSCSGCESISHLACDSWRG